MSNFNLMKWSWSKFRNVSIIYKDVILVML